MALDMNVEALTRLVGGAKDAARRREVAGVLGVNEQSLYQIISGAELPSGRPKGVGSILRRKLDAKYPGWNLPQPQHPPSISAALQEVLKAIDGSSHKDELRLLLPLVVTTNAKAYRMRLQELLEMGVNNTLTPASGPQS